MSNRLFQGLVYQMRDTVDRMIGVVDESAPIIACSDLTKIGEPNDFLAAELGENNELFIRDGITYKPFGSKMKSEYAVFVSGTDDLAAKMCGVLSISLSSIKQYYDEKYDRGNFIKNIILDNILPGDIFAKARELHFGSDVPAAWCCWCGQQAHGRRCRVRRGAERHVPGQAEGLSCCICQRDGHRCWSRRSRPAVEGKDLVKLAALYRGDAGRRAVGTKCAGEQVSGVDCRHEGSGTSPSREAHGGTGGRRGIRHRDVSSSAARVWASASLIYQVPTTLCEHVSCREVFQQGFDRQRSIRRRCSRFRSSLRTT